MPTNHNRISKQEALCFFSLHAFGQYSILSLSADHIEINLSCNSRALLLWPRAFIVQCFRRYLLLVLWCYSINCCKSYFWLFLELLEMVQSMCTKKYAKIVQSQHDECCWQVCSCICSIILQGTYQVRSIQLYIAA